MNKQVILSIVILIIIAFFFIPVSQQKTVSIKASFLTIYPQLLVAGNWEKWRPDLKNTLLTDAGKVSLKTDSNTFTISCPGLQFDVKAGGDLFTIHENNKDKSISYSYTIVPDKSPGKTFIVVNKSTNIVGYLAGKFAPPSFADTHIDDFKKFIETDSLYYGCNIFKTRIPGGNLVVIRKEVVSAHKFDEAAKNLKALRLYLIAKHLKQIFPVIAQFIAKGKDSTQVNVGFFVDKETTSTGDFDFERMPVTGSTLSAKFSGKFRDRQRIYDGLKQYFTVHMLQFAIIPFETYFDNKLPDSDTSKVNMQVNFGTY